MTFVTEKLEEISLPHRQLSHYTFHQDKQLAREEWLPLLDVR